jgi:hypothetical protein
MDSSPLARRAILAAAFMLISACGIPRDGSTRAVADDDVPYRLLQSSAAVATPTPPPDGREVTLPQVFLLDSDRQLVPRALQVPVGSPQQVADAALLALASGPTDPQRASGLSTALGPDVRVRLVDLAEGTARVSLDVLESGVSADRLPLAVGQVVLTAVSVQGVDRVLLVRDGQPIGAPLPGGEQTTEPLVADDYASLLAAGTSRPLKASTNPSP